ncbi:hypothetical protein [Thermodesulfovibrio hydrogeniphilus]
MSPRDEIDSVGPYRSIRPIKEGSVFARYKVKKKTPKKESSEEEKLPKEKKDSEHRIDIEA